MPIGSYTRKQIISFATFCISNFCSALCFSLQAPFYPREAEKRGATATQYGFVFGVFELTMFLCSPLFGRYLSVIGPSFLFSTGVFTAGLSCILFGLLDKVYETNVFLGLSFLTRIFESIGSSAAVTSSLSLVSNNFPENTGSCFAIMEMFFGVGLIIGPTVGGALYEVGGYTLPFLVLGSTLLVTGLLAKLILPADNYEISTSTPRQSQTLKALKIFGVFICMYTTAAAAFSIGFLQATLEPYIRPLGLSPFQTGLMFVISGGTYALTCPLWGIVCDKFKNSHGKAMTIGAIFLILTFLFMGPVPFIPFQLSLSVCITTLFLHGIALGAQFVGTFSGALSFAVENGFEDNIDTSGLITGIWTSASALGGFTGPSLSGYLYDTIGFQWGSLVVVGQQVIVLILIATLVIKNRTKETIEQDDERQSLLPKQTTTYGNTEDSDIITNGRNVLS